MTGVARLLPPSASSASVGRLLVRQRRDLHDPRPVLPVAVPDEEQDRRAERHGHGGRRPGSRRGPARSPGARRGRSPSAGARGRPRWSSSVSASPAGTPSIVTPSAGPCDSPAVRKRKRSRRRVGQPRRARFAGRLALGRARPPARASASFACISSSGAGWPVHSVNAAAPWWSSISSPSERRARRPPRRRAAGGSCA